MNSKLLSFRKYSLLIVIASTAVFPLFFLRLNESFHLNLFKVLAKAGSLCGTVLLIWQFLLGYRVIGGRLIKDFIWVLKLHKTIGKYALFLIVLHPVFISFYYIEKGRTNPLLLQTGFPFDTWVLFGMAALGVLILVVVTSVFFRIQMSFKWWYGSHLTSYLAILMIFVHSIPIGQTIGETSLKILWWGLVFFMLTLCLFRIVTQLGFGVKMYRICAINDAEDEACEIICQPIKGRIIPRIGQFIYFRKDRREFGRPFTVSHLNKDNLSITVKAQGRYSSGLQSIEPGRCVYIDGPYGIFLQEALQSNRPLIMIAGGIGITPFYRLLTETTDRQRDMILFYGNQTTNDIIYKNELEKMKHVKVVHVITHQDDYPGETGYITLDIIKKYAQQDFKQYDFLLCGPPAMIKKVEQMLTEAAIPQEQIHHEMFSF